MRGIQVMRFLLFLSFLFCASAAYSQTADAGREKTRERLSQLLQRVGPDIKVTFRQSEKQPFNFVGVMREGLTNSDSLEIVISVTPKETVAFRIYPHYKGNYINIDKVRNSPELMRRVLKFSDRTFLFWGADDTGDVFTGYTFTLESGFPDEAIKIVLASIVNSDKFIGELKPAIDGSAAP